ncbi:mitochondrial ribosomal death-associated protein 3-domain-containing protein [Clohesyomyces aquaticus]|uniref:Small ribosomal subunit protein mS29 n=1 Tax=Clohesyomyces aquaticus TaxID=1231657 RepID=A0A1Y1ZLV9_9PLEO|nr:mitochondrial ribosomal death-associated protein 3-domain-containing protein [Clohesyomyces aquaticus]
MSSSQCLRSFFQLSLDRAAHQSIASRSLLTTPQTACFSISASRCGPPPRKGMIAPPKRGERTLNVKKGKGARAQDTSKRPAPGERKAQRKRIVLSNNNALEVPTLQDLSKETVLKQENEGQVKGLPEAVVDALRAVEAFKPTQGWRLFRRPAILMRRQTMQLVELVKQVEDAGKGAAKQTLRRVLVGERLCGKSTLLLQALTVGFLRDWVVINLPDAQDITNAHTEYAPLPGSQPTMYTQDTYTANLLSQIATANGPVLEKFQVTTKPSLPVPIPSKCNLKQLAELAIANPEASWPIFVALWNELSQPGRPPIMLGVDNVAHMMKDSDYLSADIKPIHSHDLAIVRHFVDHLSGKTALRNGGIVLAATSGSNSPTIPGLDHSIQVAEARKLDPENVPQWNPYKKVDQRVVDCLKDIEVVRITGLSKEEARTVIEYYAASGMLRAQVTDPFVTEKWSLAGMGNIGYLERAAVRERI